ncbi:N-acetylmuramoyl-L-alanine amidase [Streptomyces shenzhenensis]|uniref:N-acetylmuramoyl-L-alanine amidase n=1 Tax=Streptomyces shenzhenensis TaxID=943815 RepID=A0A3M0HUY7_9ACTN|nr:N-acetylmuramoyl-L-alanine amidase [Streptomyces shenzhenensis]RMB81271.1 N-acetylmuramoyl-L-alanine amidase [Streptomyces shenzhenensis]
MAEPMTAAAFHAALRAEGVTVVEVGNWRTHNRNHKGAWGPVHGVMVHHTVTSGTARTVAICRDGYASLPGPLCHGMIAKDGRVHLVGYGRANHAGLGDGDVLQAVIAETPLPADNEADTDGNARFYGFECENLGDGKDPWPEAQLDAIERVAAAICRVHGWNERSIIGHLEWQPGKVDPRGFTMDSMRARIAARLKAGTPAKPASPSAPAKPKVSLAHVVYAARHDPPAAQGHTTHKAEVLTVEKALKAEGLLGSAYVDGSFGTKTIDAYARWQRSPAGGGYTGRDADGIPGKASLKRLAARHGFTVTD